MAMVNPYQQYKQNSVQTATPERLVTMVLDLAVRSVKQAKISVEQGRVELVHQGLMKAQDCILELQAALDMEAGGEIAQNLNALYDYLSYRLTEANLHKDSEMMDEAAGMLQDLRDTWIQAVKIAKGYSQGDGRVDG